MTTIRPLQASEWPQYRAMRLRALADSPDAFGSTWAAEVQRPDVLWQERLQLALASNQDLPLCAVIDAPTNKPSATQMAGLLWAKVDAEDARLVHLFQMWVAPEQRGQGIGGQLLAHARRWAEAQCAHSMLLGVTCGDTPALRLYARMGFSAYGAPTPLREGSALLAQSMRLSLR